ncbi:uncharacterized protein LOC144487746 [Mustelus asterias]
MKEQCRVCATELKGTQRRWIFSSRAAVPLRVVLAHVLGQGVTRDGRGEFLCGKCAFALERVYRFDTVIARVKALSIEKVQRLLAEKDKLARCLSHLHGQRHPLAGGPSYTGQDITVDIANLPHVQYNVLLQEDLALSEFECWSEKSGAEFTACPCSRQSCAGCSAFRVSDSTYESVCKIPRRLARALAKGHLFQLSKSKSQSMPLDWLRIPDRRASASNSVQSLCTDSSRSDSRSLSVSSLGAALSSEDQVFDDCLSPISPLDWPLATAVHWMRSIAYRPVHSPPGSKIPIRIRSGGSLTSGDSETPRRQLSFTSDEEPFRDLGSEFAAEYLPFKLERLRQCGSERDDLPQASRPAGEQNEAARGRIQILEEQSKESISNQQELSLEALKDDSLREHGHQTYGQSEMIQHLACELHSKEQLLQGFMELFRQLASGTRPEADVEGDITEKLRSRLKERDTALQRSADEKFAALEGKETEILHLRKALREKDRDLSRLGEVLVRNEEMINMLNHALKTQHTAVEQLETLCRSLKEAGSQRAEGRVRALREKDGIITQLQAALQNRASDVEALTDSLLSQGLSDDSDSSACLYLRLKDTEQLLSRVLAEQTHQAADHTKAIEELLKSIDDKDQMIKGISANHLETLAIQAQDVLALKQRLCAREKELAQLAKSDGAETQDCFIELASLKTLLAEKDQLILNILEDGKERDRILACLKDQLCDSVLLKVGMKQTL